MAALLLFSPSVLAGPPYVTDDPAPTDYRHYEIDLYTSGMHMHGDTSGESGAEFNYGAAPDLQLSAILPIAYDSPRDDEAQLALAT